MRALPIAILFASTFWAGCHAEPPDQQEMRLELEAWMTGVFSSAQQAEDDGSYFAVRVATAPIWTDRTDGPWIYVEQAMEDALERPYRQRVYRLTPDPTDPTCVLSIIHTLPGDPLNYVGAWKDPSRLKALSPDELIRRDGCALHLRKDSGAYAGETNGRDCGSNLRGASYATSSVTVRPDQLVSWDRGFDENGKQVWGAETGPYVFDRIQSDTNP